MGEFADEISRVLSVAPSLKASPGLATSLANAGADDGTVAATAALDYGLRTSQYLRLLPQEVQASAFSHLSAAQQDMVRQAGYTAPEPKKKRGGIFGAIAKVADGISNAVDFVVPEAAEDAIGAVANPIGDGASNLLDAAVKPLQGVQRYYRATELFEYDQRDPGKSGLAGMWQNLTEGSPIAAIWNRDDWSKAWEQAKDGEKNFIPDELEEIRGKYDATVFELAKQVAEGKNASDIFAEDPRDEVYSALNSADFGKALAELDDAKLSVGRVIANGLGIQRDTKTFSLISGTADGLASWYADPLLIAGKANKARKAAKYGLAGGGSRRIAQLFEHADVVRAWDNITERLVAIQDATQAAKKAQALREIEQAFPSVSGLIDPMLKAGVRNSEDAKQFLMGQDGILRILGGQAAHRVPLMPKLSRLGEKTIALRSSETLDWLSRGPRMLADDMTDMDPAELGNHFNAYRRTWRGRMATVGVRLTTKIPETGAHLSLTSPTSYKEVAKLAATFGTREYGRQIGAAYLTANVSGRRQIVKGILATVGESSGITQSAEGRRWWAEFVDSVGGKTRAYSPSGKDVLDDGRRVAVRTSQMREVVTIPSFREMYAQAARVGVLDRIGAKTTGEGVDWFMSSVFKPGVLLRPALAIRNAGEELVNEVLRNGAGHLVGARLAVSGTARLAARDRELTPLANALLKHLPLDARQRIVDAKSWFREHQLNRIERFVGTKMLGDDAARYLDEAAESSYHMKAYARDIAQTSKGGLGYMGQEGELIARARRGSGRLTSVRLLESGPYRERTADGLAGAQRWFMQIDDILSTPEGKVAVQHLGDKPAAISKLTELIESKEFAEFRKASEMYAEKGAAGWADAIYDDTLAHFSSQLPDEAADIAALAGGLGSGFDEVVAADGSVILAHRADDAPRVALLDELVAKAKAGEEITLDDLTKITEDLRPKHVIGKEYLGSLDGTSVIGSLVRGGFDEIGRWNDWLSRQPVFYARYVEARQSLAGVEAELAARVGDAAAKRLVVERATDIAGEKTLAFVDNPEVRSQFSVTARNLFPFWRAQEEFYARWARTFVHSPEAVRKGQLIFDGIRHSGFVHTDDQGNAYFVYPGSAMAHKAFVKAAGYFGMDVADLPVPYEMRGQVKFLNAGLEGGLTLHGMLPAAGPIVAAPLSKLADVFPDLQGVERAVLGEQGAGRNPVMAFLPTPVRRLIDAYNGDEKNSQMASAMRQAAAYLEHAGLSPADTASAGEIDAYQERLKMWARSIMLMRVAYGMSAPTPLEGQDIAPDTSAAFQREGLTSIKDEFNVLVRKLGFEEALAVFLKQHPDGSPFTVSQSESESGAYIPATAPALKFLQKNDAVLRNYPLIAPFLIPQDAGEFDPNAYRQELANGLRARKEFSRYYRDLKISGQVGFYFDQRKKRDDYIAEAKARGDSAAAAAERENFSAWSERFKASHPLFAEYLSEGSSRQEQRRQAVRELGLLVADPNAPKGPATEAFGQMLQAYQAHTAYLEPLVGNRTKAAIALRDQEKANFKRYMETLAASNANAAGVYNRVFRYLED